MNVPRKICLVLALITFVLLSPYNGSHPDYGKTLSPQLLTGLGKPQNNVFNPAGINSDAVLKYVGEKIFRKVFGREKDVSFLSFTRLGAGGLGSVYKLMYSRQERGEDIHETFLVKFPQKKDDIDSMEREIAVYREIDRSIPGVPQFFGGYSQNDLKIKLAGFGEEMDRTCILAMEFLDGESLDASIKDQSLGSNISKILQISMQLSETLGELHAKGIVVCDIKPQNIMLTKSQQTKIFDFNASVITTSESANNSLGIYTPNYTDPSRFIFDENGNISIKSEGNASADIYSLGCVFYELITKKILFAGSTTSTVLTQQTGDLSNKFDELGKSLDSMLEKFLQDEELKSFAKTAEDFIVDIIRNALGDAGKRYTATEVFSKLKSVNEIITSMNNLKESKNPTVVLQAAVNLMKYCQTTNAYISDVVSIGRVILKKGIEYNVKDNNFKIVLDSLYKLVKDSQYDGVILSAAGTAIELCVRSGLYQNVVIIASEMLKRNGVNYLADNLDVRAILSGLYDVVKKSRKPEVVSSAASAAIELCVKSGLNMNAVKIAKRMLERNDITYNKQDKDLQFVLSNLYKLVRESKNPQIVSSAASVAMGYCMRSHLGSDAVKIAKAILDRGMGYDQNRTFKQVISNLLNIAKNSQRPEIVSSAVAVAMGYYMSSEKYLNAINIAKIMLEKKGLNKNDKNFKIVLTNLSNIVNEAQGLEAVLLAAGTAIDLYVKINAFNSAAIIRSLVSRRNDIWQSENKQKQYMVYAIWNLCYPMPSYARQQNRVDVSA